MILYYMSKTIKIWKILYNFYVNNTYQIGLLKTWGSVV